MLEDNSEKLTINISVVDLGKIDYLVEHGFYGNRTDFIRTAIKGQLSGHDVWMNKEFISKTMDIGVIRMKIEDLAGKQYQDYTVLGKLVIDPAISLDEVKKVYRKIIVFGKVQCSDEIKKYYAL